MKTLPYVSKFGTLIRRAHHTDAGLDLATPGAVTLAPGQMTPVDTGVAVAIPDGHVGLVFVRSSIGIKKLVSLANGTGVIDAGYRGTIKVALVNNGIHTVEFDAGERIAQLVILPCTTPTPIAVSSVEPTTWELIHARMVERGMSAKQVAKETGVAPSTLRAWRLGTEPSITHLRSLGQVLDIDFRELIGGETERGTGGIGSTGQH